MPRSRPSSSVLHGGWVLASASMPAGFAVWGEQSPNLRMRPRTPRKRPEPPVIAPPHPFALSDDGVRHALSTMGLTRWATQTNVRHVYACVPTIPQADPPYSAPHRSTEPVEAPENLKPGLWQVPAVVLDEVATVSLLPRIAAASAANPGALGADLRAWIVAARFALSLLVRQKCMPRLQTPQEEILVSRWSPVIDDPSDRATLRAIERSMPPAATALSWEPHARQATAADTLADYLAATIDRVARRARPQPGEVSELPALISAWISALVREDPLVHLQGEGALALGSIVRWTNQSADESVDTAFRLCFRLDPPLDPNTPWQLEYLLQATDDPSLLVPVEAVWKHRGSTARFLTRRFDQPQERVLEWLNGAGKVFAPIETSLKASSRPESCALSTREAADLVRDKVLLLQAKGYGVLLPGLETRLNVRLRLRPAREADRLKTDGPALLSFNSLVSYDWQLALGDQPLTREEFEMLAHLKEPLVQLRGRWVDVRPDQIERALAFIQKHQSAAQMPLTDAVAVALAPTSLDGVQVAEVEASGWIDSLLEDIQKGARAETVPAQPDGFNGMLRGYQQRGVAWLATLQRYNLGALLADDMGLGKALGLETPILTPTGWKSMGEICVGDEVINAAGGSSYVTAVYPQGDKELYRVVFSDGASVECCDEHLWYVCSAAGQPGKVLALRDFMHDLRDAAGNARYSIPMVQPIEFRGGELPLDPYQLGLLLAGKGAAETFLPEQYKFASVTNRVALLQGLLDTDGCVHGDDDIEYATVSPRLATDVIFLVQSLGGTARICADSSARRVSIVLPPEIVPFRLGREAALYQPRSKPAPARAIVDVQPVGRKPAQCISVDSPNGLYVTDHCIVTHNTAQIIALLLHAGSAGEAGPTLVICPTSVVGNWRHELNRFAPDVRVLVHHGSDRAAGEELLQAAGQHDVVLSTYALLHRDEAALTRVKWDGLVLDEAQNVKNASTRAAQAARAIAARWRVALTGTPVENRLADLWSIFEVINPGYLGSAEEFRREFALPIERASDADASARLKALTSPFILRRVKTDRSVIADLPDKQEMKVYCSLSREQATLYEAVLQDTMRQIAASEGIQRRGLVLALLTRLKQVCNHPALLMHDGSPLAGRSGKLARLTEMLEEVVAGDERALVFTQYAEMGSLLRDHLRETLEREVLFLHGGTPMAERDRMVSEFQSDANGPPIFVLSLKAGGTGLNLTRANHVFHFDRWWNPAVENQATDRAFRIGQTRNVQVHKYVCAGTFEETLDDLIERKVALAESIVGTSEAWITEMSTDDLRQLFRLRRDEAVAEDEAA